MRIYHVYILASISRVLYTGMSGNLGVRLWAHRSKRDPKSFTAQYNVTKLVYLEEYSNPVDAILREKQIKAWRRSKRVNLIESLNPEWEDLASELVAEVPVSML
ncbi:MAG: putative endonuclease [Acidobacteriota bacterium]|jgi:putative endonuclease|nr:putative endonuclease [Acidobacteriota bacterium]